jgi:O-acetyl-ADP-ribose deacetylase (regulator of RNase III)/NAD-dependent SIR2 family protein deacetylase
MIKNFVDTIFDRAIGKGNPSFEAKRKAIGDHYIATFDQKHLLWSEEMIGNMDQILEYESKQVDLVELDTIPRIGTDEISSKIRIWRGDITRLHVDAIVNAGNSALLGCFQASHMCIDNVIHRKAGPRLRIACFKELGRMGKRFINEGECIITDAFYLSCSFVIHAVGPQISQSDSSLGKFEISTPFPSDEQITALKNCYRNSLDIASVNGVKSIAFCCISTGIFGFPKRMASEIALRTTVQWLKETGKQIDVIFNVFTSADELFYSTRASSYLLKTGISSDENKLRFASPKNEIVRMIELFKSADRILIAAGAGFSAAEGLDYNSQDLFQFLFPAMHKRGFRCMYEFIGYRKWSPALQWGYLLSSVNQARFNWKKPNGIYFKLLELLKNRNYFVLTSNADGMFEQNGFDLDRLYTPQGDYSRLQCLAPCSGETWSTKAVIDQVLSYISPKTQEITRAELIPTCPKCSGPVMLNVRGGDWFIEDHFSAQNMRYVEWLKDSSDKKLLILELGVGYNTPSVIRWPMEELASRYSQSHLIRVNTEHPQIDHPRAAKLITDRYSALRISALELIQLLYDSLL